jgi:uncharacterized membrane protein
MHLFESHILVDGSVEDCEKVWKKCIHAWLVNDSFLDVRSLAEEHPQSSPLKDNSFEWDIAANSNEHHKVILWHQRSSSLETSGIIDFYDIPTIAEMASSTEVTIRVTVLNELKGITGFRIESKMGEILYRNLKQFKHFVNSSKHNQQSEEAHYAIA